MSKKIEDKILEGKIKEVKDKTLHKNWLAWYYKRKNTIGSNKMYSKIMLNGLVKDFYSVNDNLQSKLTELEQENERFRNGLNNIVYKSKDGNYYNRFMENYPLNVCEFSDIDELLTNKTNK